MVVKKGEVTCLLIFPFLLILYPTSFGGSLFKIILVDFLALGPKVCLGVSVYLSHLIYHIKR